MGPIARFEYSVAERLGRELGLVTEWARVLVVETAVGRLAGLEAWALYFYWLATAPSGLLFPSLQPTRYQFGLKLMSWAKWLRLSLTRV